ncbi:LOW QUALITY PROTEIN: probable UDP-3-O-acylglucosamine N-acyltransferase 2, mitochondrial [Phaseolus vulgaris]|uniref:LOW QUALITY PROTEIN: probable UDP-3-O-acylglucosamine N-acyltransferase 2, mitochondrial n=1 Tax=Phaseolus vulgaris TaxID=3885 RepID=UPI0035CAC385
MTMAGRRLLAFACSSSTPFLKLNQNLNFHCIFSPPRHFSAFSASPEDATFSDKFHKWNNGGGTFHESACIDSTALVEVGAVVHSESVVGPNVRIGSGTIVGPSVTVAHSTKIGYNVALSNCCIGDSCVIHNGVSIGQDGFGFYVDDEGNMIKKPQTLNVIIGNNVEIGSNTCIDRGSWRDTVIGDNSKIDNLVQIGHNVVIGTNCLLCGQVGIAGSATIGDYVTMGGRVAVRDHVSIVSKVRLAAASFVTKDIKEPGDYGGFPAVSIHQWRRQVASRCQTRWKQESCRCCRINAKFWTFLICWNCGEVGTFYSYLRAFRLIQLVEYL